MAWFDATVDDVLRKIQNNQIDANNFGGTSEVESIMTRYEGDIRSQIPNRTSQMVNQGLIEGHIVVNSADKNQTTGDDSQPLIATPSRQYFFLNWYKSRNPIPNKDTSYQMVEGIDYTLTGTGQPSFSVKPLNQGDQVVATYYTAWDDSVGLESLQWLLIEGSALELMRNAGVANNSTLADDIASRSESWLNQFNRLQSGELIPVGVTQLDLVREREVNDNSNNVRSARIVRG